MSGWKIAVGRRVGPGMAPDPSPNPPVAADVTPPRMRHAGWLPVLVLGALLGIMSCTAATVWVVERIAVIGADDY